MKGRKSTGLFLACLTIFLLILFVNACSINTVEDIGVTRKLDEGYKNALPINVFLEGDVNSVLPSENQDFVKKMIEEKFNVKLNITQMTLDDKARSKLNLMIASGESPDLFVTPGAWATDLASDNVLKDLKPYLTEDRMPHLFQWISRVQVDAFQLNDHFVRGPVPTMNRFDYSYYIRKDWLNRLGLDYPTNYQELTEVMRAFTYNDPDGNGIHDTYGISMPGQGQYVYYAFPQFKNHGVYAEYFVDPETKNFHSLYSMPEVGEALDDLRVWIARGYVDPDWFLNDIQQVANKFVQGKIGMIWAMNPKAWVFESQPDSYYNQLKKHISSAEVMPFNPYPGEPVWTEPLMWKSWQIYKNTETEKVEKIIDIVNWLMSEEGFLLTHYGIEGKHYTRNNNDITLNWDAFSKDVLQNGNFLSVWDSFTPDDPNALGINVIDPRLTSRDKQIKEHIASYPTIQGLGTNVFPPENFDFNSYIEKRSRIQVKVLLNEENSSNWPIYVAELMNDYGGNKLFRAYVNQMQEAGIEVNDWQDK